MSYRILNVTLGSFLLLMALAVLQGDRALAAGEKIHPAVVRVVVPEGSNATSYGSGTLVAASETTGLVITNWHVVRDRDGQIEVRFPNGFRSAARVLRTDRDWDLAALLVWRPQVDPVKISNRAPQKGEALSIAGYGSGNYRMASGKCVQYLSPGGDKPFDIVELSAGARQGDSGGPILNQYGEMAGVLFGSAKGYTSGSHAVRVRNFLSQIDPQLADGRLAPQPKASQSQTEYAQNVTPGPRVGSEYKVQRLADPQKVDDSQAPAQTTPSQQKDAEDSRGAWIGVPGNFPSGAVNQTPAQEIKPAPQWQQSGSAPQVAKSPQATTPANSPESQGSGEADRPQESKETPQGKEEVSDPKASKEVTLWDQTKNVLSFIGCLAILVQVAKLLNPEEPKKSTGGRRKK